MKKLSREDYFLASHGELNEKGACRHCLRDTELDRFYCGGVVPGDTELTDDEMTTIEEVGVQCQECQHIYHKEDVVGICGNCEVHQNVEPLPYIWVWAYTNDLMPLS